MVLATLMVLMWPARPSRRAASALIRAPADSGAGPVAARLVVRGAARSVRESRATGVSPWDRLRRWRHRGVALPVDELLPLLDGLAAALRAGLPAADALDLVSADLSVRVQELVGPVRAAARTGYPCATAWNRVARESASPDLALLARTWGVSEQLGAPLADGVDSAARGLRSRRELASRLTAATAGARTTATILTALPVAGLGLAALMGIGPAVLYGTPVAVASLVLGCVLLAIGRVVVQRMISQVGESS